MTSNSKPSHSQRPEKDHHEVAQEINWKDYRDHLATADQKGNRKWIFPKKPEGKFYRARTYVSWLLLLIMFVGPFVRIQGNPLLMLNVVSRKFVILGQIFWPQDSFIFAVAMLIFLTGIIVFTAAFGRLWCGWTCPQTLLMEMVFRKIEYFIDGDAHQQRALDKSPWNRQKLTKRVVKHSLFFGLSFIIGNTLLSYIIGSDALIRIITDNPFDHLKGLGSMVVFTIIFYLIFARFREQACTFICPYGRLQSTLLDQNSIIVAYDEKRGESRSKLQRNKTLIERRQAGSGDCIDCQKCVTVCPTGIDIRDGLQMDCVNCTACIDACDDVMRKIDRPEGLIRYASRIGLETGEELRFSPRIIGYSFVLVALISTFLILVFTRSPVETSLFRAPGALFQTMPDGQVSNLYTLKLANKTHQQKRIILKLQNIPGEIKVLGTELIVEPEALAKTSVLVKLSPEIVTNGRIPLVFGVFDDGKQIETIHTVFIGPQNQSRNSQ
jgi:cytochrome c oxidase accessory protein FixG